MAWMIYECKTLEDAKKVKQLARDHNLLFQNGKDKYHIMVLMKEMKNDSD